MKTLGNIIWIVFGGLHIALEYFIAGLLLMITIIGIPFGKMHFRLAKLALSPFGKEVVSPMNKNEKRELQRKRLMDNKAYQTMSGLTRYMDRYYLDALIGIIPGWGDAIALLCVVPFVYFSSRVIKSIPLTLAVLNNALRDVLLGMIPFFVGDVIDIFHRANTKNMAMIQGFVDGDETVIKQVNQRAWQSAIFLIVLLLLIAMMIWAFISFGSYLYSLVASVF